MFLGTFGFASAETGEIWTKAQSTAITTYSTTQKYKSFMDPAMKPVVGMQLPANVTVYPLPATVTVKTPDMYSYGMINDQPVIIERNGLRIAFLAYCSVLRDGYEARNDKAGIAPLRAYTYYESRDSNPGVPPRVVSAPYQEDLDAMLEDVTAARKLADSVVLSMHWGIHYYEKIVAEYQPISAHAAIDAGADLILGHHPHLLKAIEVYKGKVCFYSLGEFIMQLERTPQNAAALVRKYGIKLDPNYPKLAHGEGCHRVLIAKAVFTKQGIQKVSCLPVMINPDLRPEALRRGDPRFDDMVRYAEWISEGYDHKFTVDGDEICITA